MSFTSHDDADRSVESAFLRHKAGDLSYASQIYQRVLAEFPSHPAALHYLGLIAQQSGNSREAIRLLQQSIAKRPSDPRTHNHLGQVHVTTGDMNAARSCFERAVEVDPNHVDSLNNLANVVKVREPQRGVALYRRALELDPHSANANYNLGNLLIEEHETNEARVLIERAIAAGPRHYQAYHALGVLNEQQGRFDDALRCYEQALTIKPGFAPSLANLIAMRGYTPDAATVAAAEALIRSPSMQPEQHVKLQHGLGRHYDKQGDYGRAFRHFVAAKALVRERTGAFNVAPLAAQFDRLIGTFTRAFFNARAQGSESRQPIFIVGMPRSGTTLIEQILASHAQVFGAGELPQLPRIVKGLRPEYPENVVSLDEYTLDRLRAEYLEALCAQAPQSAVHITDKLPVNFINLGMIATLFPRAPVIHCRRDPLDVGLSSLIELFAFDSDYTTTLASFGEYYREYDRLMKHWREALPRPMFELDYEALVRAPAAHIRALLDFCGLPWDDNCLSFFATQRTVRTPSRWQVRQPIYTSSVARWRHYAVQLEPLRQYLDMHDLRPKQV